MQREPDFLVVRLMNIIDVVPGIHSLSVFNISAVSGASASAGI